MLPAKKLDLGLTLNGFGSRQNDAPAGTEYRVIYEQLLDPDLAFQALSFGDPGNGFVGGFRLTDEALLQNFEREPLFKLHSRGT